MYFTVTTIVTTGYGDICAYNSTERFYCIILMLIGVVSFSYMTGALTSIIGNRDSKEAKVNEQMNTLRDI